MAIATTNVRLFDQSTYAGSTNKIEIHTTRIERDWLKNVTDILRPTARRNQPSQGGSQQVTTWILDLNRVKRVLNVDGVIVTNSTDGSREAQLAKLIALIENGQVVNMAWDREDGAGTYSYTVAFLNVKITDDANNLEVFPVKLQLLIGTNR